MLVVKTASGSTYEFDNNRMTWSRRNPNPGHEDIRWFNGGNRGTLEAPVEPRVHERLTFYVREEDGVHWIVTTPVVSVSEEWREAEVPA